MPDQHHNNRVEDGQDKQAERMGVGVAVDLIDHECAQRRERSRIRPQLASQKPDNQEQLYQAVAEQVGRRRKNARWRSKNGWPSATDGRL